MRIMKVESLSEMFAAGLSISNALTPDRHAALIRVGLCHVISTMLFRDGHAATASVTRSMLDIGEFLRDLPPVEGDAIARIYRDAAVKLIAIGQQLSAAARAVSIARNFAPSDGALIALQVLIDLLAGRLPEIPDLLVELERASTDAVLVNWLKADSYMALARPHDAIAPFERAIEAEDNEEHRQTLHFNAAFAYGMSDSLAPRQRADGIIQHLEDAIQIQDSPVHHVIKAFAWALRKDQAQYETEVDKAYALARHLNVSSLLPFIEYWKARALRELGRSEDVADTLASVADSSEKSEDTNALVVLASASIALAGVAGIPEHLANGESYLHRVLELDPTNGKAFKYLGVVYVLRAQNASDSKERLAAAEKARTYLVRALRLGESPDLHGLLGKLYNISGDPVNAAKHRKRWLELAPENQEAMAYEAFAILDRTNDLAKAKAHLDALEVSTPSLSAIYVQLATQAFRAPETTLEDLVACKACLQKAIALGNNEAETADSLTEVFSDLLSRHDPSGLAALYREWLDFDHASFIANDNLAFLLFDAGDYGEALCHWEQALKTSPEAADAHAGKAVALAALQQNEEALASYRTALSLSPEFLDEDAMRTIYAWSEKALVAVRPLMAKLRVHTAGA